MDNEWINILMMINHNPVLWILMMNEWILIKHQMPSSRPVTAWIRWWVPPLATPSRVARCNETILETCHRVLQRWLMDLDREHLDEESSTSATSGTDLSEDGVTCDVAEKRVAFVMNGRVSDVFTGRLCWVAC